MWFWFRDSPPPAKRIWAAGLFGEPGCTELLPRPANPLEQNIRFYKVVKGIRYKLASFDYIISVDTWHVFLVVARDNHIQIIFDGQKVFDMQDETFQSGQIGLWPKADAVTYFDDLRLSVVK